MIHSAIGPLPRHLYVWVDARFTHREFQGRVPAVWFGLVSHPGRMWGCNVMFESGAVYRNVPPHAIFFHDHVGAQEEWRAQDAQTWDCYGYQFAVLEYPYLSGLRCRVRTRGGEHLGRYLFTCAPVADGFSQVPEQSKEFSFLQLDNGRLTIQPTNHVIYEERSFTSHEEFPNYLKRQTEIWRCE